MGIIILSIDPGCKNLGYSLIRFDKEMNRTNIMDPCVFFKDNDTDFIELKNIDVTKIKNTNNKSSGGDIYDKVVLFLLNIVNKLDLTKDFLHIIIEKQMKISVNISEISSIISTFFATYFILNKDKGYNYKITIISPHFKNKIASSIDVDNKIRINYINQYQYNKHLVELYFLKLNENLKIINQDKYVTGSGKHVSKLNDISDSFIQILSFIQYYLK